MKKSTGDHDVGRASNFRLNDQHRSTILQRALARAFDAEEAEIREVEATLGGDVYDDVYPKPLQSKMSRMLGGFLPLRDNLPVSFGCEYVWLRLDKKRLIAYRQDEGLAARSYEADHPYSRRHSKIVERQKDLRARRDKARGDVKALLASCNTSRQLLEIWPEASLFMGDLSATSGSTALAVPVKEINAELGLSGAG